ncbi:MAG: hypothetical protein ABL962_10235, partial [Fimbriimonadaceae bacterium]
SKATQVGSTGGVLSRFCHGGARAKATRPESPDSVWILADPEHRAFHMLEEKQLSRPDFLVSGTINQLSALLTWQIALTSAVP